ncbi:hypothetical protein [Novosphingobium kunmingense]|uniref:hypothetical protein n=1 Tax=Novosphingobium kunmingense TaxID=1211806 RepID=UPI000C2C3323|nr:hypothetical protein [Novosphingobium kunmingense]
MNRIVLALLALFAGIVAQAAPTQARMSGNGNTEINALERIESAARPCAASPSVADQGGCRVSRRERTVSKPRGVRTRVYIPSVLFGPDRALE